MKKWILCQKVVQLNCQKYCKYFFQFILHFIWFWFEFNETSRERPSERESFMVSENWWDLSRENPRYGVLSSRRVVTKSYFEIHQKVLHHTLKIQKKLVGTYFLPQKLISMFYDNFLPVNTRLIITGLYQDYLPHILCEIWPPRYLEDLVDWIIYFEPTVIRTHHGTPSLKPPSLYLSKNKNLMFWWPTKVQGASHWINFKKCYIFSKKKKKTLWRSLGHSLFLWVLKLDLLMFW